MLRARPLVCVSTASPVLRRVWVPAEAEHPAVRTEKALRNHERGIGIGVRLANHNHQQAQHDTGRHYAQQTAGSQAAIHAFCLRFTAIEVILDPFHAIMGVFKCTSELIQRLCQWHFLPVPFLVPPLHVLPAGEGPVQFLLRLDVQQQHDIL